MRLARATLSLLAWLCSAGCFSKPEPPAGTGDPGDAGRDSGVTVITGGSRRPVTINLTPGNAVTDAPISVIMTNDTDLAGYAPAADNIAFVMDDNTALPCEIVRFDPGAGDLEAWVRLPEVSSTQASFQIAYGPDVDSPCDRRTMWDGYMGVWHFADPEFTIARDSTRHDHHANAQAGTGRRDDGGLIGRSLVMDEQDGADRLCAMHAPTLDPAEKSFSFEVWVKPLVHVGTWDTPMWKGGKSDNMPGFDFELGTGQWAAYVRDLGDGKDNYLPLSSDPDTLLGVWSHLAVVVSREANVITYFLNGSLVGSEVPAQTTVANTYDLCFGDIQVETRFRGFIDEARVHAVARTPAWILLTHDNIARRDEFMTIGAPVQ